jgi:predicted ferric reductase
MGRAAIIDGNMGGGFTQSSWQQWRTKYGGWTIIIVSCLLPVIMWCFEDPGITNRFLTVSLTMAAIGKVTGMVGFVLYAISLVLSLRRAWLEQLFDGLNKVYLAHHITGGISLVFLMFHPLFLAIRFITFEAPESIKAAADSLLPHWFSASDTATSVQDILALDAGIVAFLGMVVLLIVTLYVKLPYHVWLWTHRFLGVAFGLAAVHTIFLNSDVTRMPVLWWYMIAWSLIGMGAYIYRTLIGNVVIRQAPYQVREVVHLGGNTVMIDMVPMGKPIHYKPGQFVFLTFLVTGESGISEREAHPFSIASSPYEPSVRLCVKALGDFTRALDNLPKGSVAQIEGAFGHFSNTNFPGLKQIWVGGGIGVTPFLSMARSLDHTTAGIHFFYSVMKREELFDQALLQDYLPRTLAGQFAYHPYVTSEQSGFLDAQYIAETVGDDLGEYEIFICGPPIMMKTLRAQLRARGVKNSTIHTEEFSML